MNFLGREFSDGEIITIKHLLLSEVYKGVVDTSINGYIILRQACKIIKNNSISAHELWLSQNQLSNDWIIIDTIPEMLLNDEPITLRLK